MKLLSCDPCSRLPLARANVVCCSDRAQRHTLSRVKHHKWLSTQSSWAPPLCTTPHCAAADTHLLQLHTSTSAPHVHKSTSDPAAQPHISSTHTHTHTCFSSTLSPLQPPPPCGFSCTPQPLLHMCTQAPLIRLLSFISPAHMHTHLFQQHTFTSPFSPLQPSPPLRLQVHTFTSAAHVHTGTSDPAAKLHISSTHTHTHTPISAAHFHLSSLSPSAASAAHLHLCCTRTHKHL